MRVLHVFKTYLPDNFTGIPRVINALAEEGDVLGIKARVLTLSSDPAANQPVVQGSHLVYQAPLDVNIRSAGFSRAAFGLFRELCDESDLVHYHFPWPMADLLHLYVRPRLPSVVSYHSDIVKQRILRHAYAPVMHRFLGQVDRIVASSPTYRKSSPVLQRYRNKTSVIPIGICARPKLSADRLRQWQNRLGEGFFLFIGSHRYYKGLTFLMEAARHSNVRIVLAGARHGVKLEELPKNVIVLDAVDEADKEALLELCCGLVLPSHLRAEAFGVVLLEAMRAARPVITCEIGSGMSYVNVAGETGLSVAPRDPEALAQAMGELANDPARAVRLGQAGQARFFMEFQASTMAQRFSDLYWQVLSA